MKTVKITPGHPLLIEIDTKLAKNHPYCSSAEAVQLIKEWYDYDVTIDYLGCFAEITMSDDEYTMWLLRWG